MFDNKKDNVCFCIIGIISIVVMIIIIAITFITEYENEYDRIRIEEYKDDNATIK